MFRNQRRTSHLDIPALALAVSLVAHFMLLALLAGSAIVAPDRPSPDMSDLEPNVAILIQEVTAVGVES